MAFSPSIEPRRPHDRVPNWPLDPDVLTRVNALNSQPQLEDDDDIEVVAEKDARLSRHERLSVRLARASQSSSVPQYEISRVEKEVEEAWTNAQARLARAQGGHNGNGCCCPCHLRAFRNKPRTSSFEDGGEVQKRMRWAAFDPRAFDLWALLSKVTSYDIAFICTAPPLAFATIYIWGKALGFF